MELKHGGLEDDCPFELGDVLRCWPFIFRGVPTVS